MTFKPDELTKEQAFKKLLKLWESDAPAGVIDKFIRTYAGVQKVGVPSDLDPGGGIRQEEEQDDVHF